MVRLAATVCVFVLALAAPAAAQYFITHDSAVSHARTHFHLAGYHYAAAECRPQGLSAAQPGVRYHSWVCAFAAGDSRFAPSCTGTIKISGSRTPGTWWFLVLSHEGPCPHGLRQ